MKDKNVTVLYIEDDVASQRLVQRVLESRSYNVFIAGDGLTGLQLAQEQSPKLILMDINLPGLNGRELTTRLRSLPNFNSVPIVALTANTGPGSREQALASGCTGFMTKPINVASFPADVESFLNGRQETLSEEERSKHLQIHAQRIVTKLEKKIHELERANQKLRELDRLKSDFIVLVSHELRTPLTLISGYTHLLHDQVEYESHEPIANIAGVVEGLDMGVARMGQVVNEIISVSRIASGLLNLSRSPTALIDLIQSVISDAEPICQSRKLTIEVSPKLKLLTPLYLDGEQIQVALENIIGNAIKYTPDQGTIHIEHKLVGDAVDLIIKDTGIGIPSQEQKSIFDQFYVLGSIEHHSTSKSAFQGGGLGLGLAIAKGIVEAHGGRIWVESGKKTTTSENDQESQDALPGSTFHLLLPITPPS